MPESHKHPQERSITNRSGRSIRARLRLADRKRPRDCPAKNTRRAGRLTEAREKAQVVFGQSGNALSHFGSEI
ncbi:MAG: hypothetical protein KAR25_01555 [Methanosarcinales archaeon]|nr:hypothetical protein [Methanosarcinales archaeon]